MTQAPLMMGSTSGDDDDLPETDASRRSRRLITTQKKHADLVDEIERGLSTALLEYRQHAEDVLERHLEDLERTELAHELEVSKLKAENAKLRESLGGKAPDSKLYQTVVMQDNPPPKTQRRGNSLAARMLSDGDDDKVALNLRKDKRQPEQPAGGWQHFVAWVPNGSGLRAPEPWSPLPDINLQIKGQPGMPALPGMVPNGEGERAAIKDHKHHDAKESGESSSDESTVEGREPFEVLEGWHVSQRQLSRLRKNNNNAEFQSRCSGSTGGGSSEHMESEDEDWLRSQSISWWVIHPHGKKRVMWDLGSLAMVVYDMFMIPMGAFHLPPGPFLDTMDWTTRIFWTLDMGWSVCTAVVLADGKINFQAGFIIKRYLKTWFGLDLIIVSSDWAEVALSGISIMGLGRIARVFRMVRIVRLLRLVRMQEVMQSITERIQSDKLTFGLSIMKMTVFVLATAHVLGCIWWAIGDQGAGIGTWSTASGFDVASIDAKYLVSLHWALCQFTGGMDEITPVTPLERFYAVVVWVVAFVAAAIILSVITSNLTHLHIIGGAQARQVATLRKYLKQNHISSNLALRMQRSATHAVSGDLAPDSVELLSVVSEPLRVEMHFEMYCNVLRNHPFFSDYVNEDPQVIRRVCHFATNTALLSKGDIVFSKGESPREPKMYFVIKGLLDYMCRGDAVGVGEKQWIAEPALWTNWTHRGTFTAATEVKLALLDAKTFTDIVHRFKGKRGFDPRLYAYEYVEHLNKTPKVDDLTFMS